MGPRNLGKRMAIKVVKHSLKERTKDDYKKTAKQIGKTVGSIRRQHGARYLLSKQDKKGYLIPGT